MDGYDIPDVESGNFKGSVFRVSTPTSFQTALSSVKPGDAIVVADGKRGSGWAKSIPQSASGLPGKPVYILSETIHGAELEGWSRWDVSASHIVIAGFKRYGSAVAELHDGASFVRFACQYTDHAGAGHYTYQSKNERPLFQNDIEIDNNIDINEYHTWFLMHQCALYNQSGATNCPGNSSNRRYYIHNNRIETVSTGAAQESLKAYIFYIGLGWSPLDLDDPINMDEPNRQEMIFENNKVRWISKGPYHSTDVKSSGNVIRNNCFINTRSINIRSGNDNLIYANWFQGASSRNNNKPHGWGNVFAFNYYSDGSSGKALIDIWRGVDWSNVSGGPVNKGYDYTWAYMPNYQNVFAYNVGNGHPSFVDYTDMDNMIKARHMSWLSDEYHGKGADNYIQHNKIYANSPPAAFRNQDDGKNGISVTKSTFEQLNPDWDTDNNIHGGPELSRDVACGTPNHVNGVKGVYVTHDRIVGGAQALHPPSWW